MKKMTLIFSIVAVILSGCASVTGVKEKHSGEKEKWGYSKSDGPAHWKVFAPTCGTGHQQSPINIVSGNTIAMNHQYDLSLHENVDSMAKIVNNGHDIEVIPDHGGSLSLDGEKFNLLQFHFHGKSEHTVNGKRYAMVAHMVHQDPITKQYAVIAVFFKEGKASPFLNTIINNVGKNVEVDPQKLLPTNTSDYYHYLGSFTTPPCTENVQWYLLKTIQTASAAQIAHFREYYLNDERPIQKLYNRTVQSN